MSARKERITNDLLELGACYAVSSEKTILPNDGYGARPSYHVHPDASYPHQNSIERFDTLADLEEYIEVRKRIQAAETEEEQWEIGFQYQCSRM